MIVQEHDCITLTDLRITFAHIFNGNIFNTEFLLGWSTYNYSKQAWTRTAEVILLWSNS